MSRTVPSFAEEGLKRFLHGMDRRVRDLERRGDWRFDAEQDDVDFVYRSGSGKLLILASLGSPIASGGDYVPFTNLVYNRGFAGYGADDVQWPVSAVGEIQVEFAWDSYEEGGTIEIEVDGVVPSWGLIAEGTAGAVGCKRRSVAIDEGATVRIKVTQDSGLAQTADIVVEFAVPDPYGATSEVGSGVLLLADEEPIVASPAPGTVFVSNLSMSFDWDGTGSLVLSSTTDGTGDVYVDNIIDLDVTHPDASTANYYHDSNPTCATGEPGSVRDVTAYFEPGVNTIDLTLSNNLCPSAGTQGCSAIYLVQL